MYPYDSKFLERFWNNVQKSDYCWIWLGYKTQRQGYGMPKFHGKHVMAHRVSLEIKLNRSIREGYLSCHTCDNPSCVNPDHLFEGTHIENMIDKCNKGRQAKGEMNGTKLHPETTAKGIRNAKAKLTDDQIRDIRYRYDNGERDQRVLAEIFGISPANVSKIVLRLTWKHI